MKGDLSRDCHAKPERAHGTAICQAGRSRLRLDKERAYNDDLIDIAWVSLDDDEKFDPVTNPIRQLLKQL